jgi:DNA-binding IclR family transcriptional regulator
MKANSIEILSLIQLNKSVSKQEIAKSISFSASTATLKRLLKSLVEEKWIIEKSGIGLMILKDWIWHLKML